MVSRAPLLLWIVNKWDVDAKKHDLRKKQILQAHLMRPDLGLDLVVGKCVIENIEGESFDDLDHIFAQRAPASDDPRPSCAC